MDIAAKSKTNPYLKNLWGPGTVWHRRHVDMNRTLRVGTAEGLQSLTLLTPQHPSVRFVDVSSNSWTVYDFVQ